MTPEKLKAVAQSYCKKLQIHPENIQSAVLLKSPPPELPKARLSVLIYTKYGLLYISNIGEKYIYNRIGAEYIDVAWFTEPDKTKSKYRYLNPEKEKKIKKYLTEHQNLVINN